MSEFSVISCRSRHTNWKDSRVLADLSVGKFEFGSLRVAHGQEPISTETRLFPQFFRTPNPHTKYVSGFPFTSSNFSCILYLYPSLNSTLHHHDRLHRTNNKQSNSPCRPSKTIVPRPRRPLPLRPQPSPPKNPLPSPFPQTRHSRRQPVGHDLRLRTRRAREITGKYGQETGFR